MGWLRARGTPPPGEHHSPTSPKNPWGRLRAPTDKIASKGIELRPQGALTPQAPPAERERGRIRSRSVERLPGRGALAARATLSESTPGHRKPPLPRSWGRGRRRAARNERRRRRGRGPRGEAAPPLSG